MIFKPQYRVGARALIFLIMGILCFADNGFAQKSKLKDPVIVNILPYNKKARFNRKFPVKYKIQFINNLKDAQEGTLVYTVYDNANQEVLQKSLS